MVLPSPHPGTVVPHHRGRVSSLRAWLKPPLIALPGPVNLYSAALPGTALEERPLPQGPTLELQGIQGKPWREDKASLRLDRPAELGPRAREPHEQGQDPYREAGRPG